MTTIYLEPGFEKVAAASPFPALERESLYHQVRTLEALRTHDLVMNTYNTGTGKTIASLLYLFDLEGQNKNVLFIAPTNALIAQHVQDIKDFVDDNKLDFKVLQVTAQEIRTIESGLRPGETLQRLMRNYLEFETEATRRQAVVLVVNPDIFYYALYFRYGAHDRRNVFSEFLQRFDYIVVDEFHYYDYKQLANFLFAFALFDHLGYFDVNNRKICLLSATPAPEVEQYLNQVFGKKRWTEISPRNEPDESAELRQVPTLSPLELTVQASTLQEWLESHSDTLNQDQQDGAIISSSLAQINEAYGLLRTRLAENTLGRITGPEAQADRLAATARRLILATPTVDIGYNFIKQNKPRQNVDFVIFDARYGDEFIQRMGRAGRVLGKDETTHPSRAIALLSSEAAQALAPYEGQTLSRAKFAELIAGCDYLPAKHTLTGYVRTYAIIESFWPIYQFGKILPPDLQHEVDDLFERVRKTFAPKSRWTKDGLNGFFWKLESRRQWLQEKQIKLNKETAKHVADWLVLLNSSPVEDRIDSSALLPKLAYLLADEPQRQGLRDFVESQLEVTQALFSFRDSFQGPTAVVYDPHHLLSSQTINAYDLFHLIRNYKLSLPLSKTQFEQSCQATDLTGDFYFRLLEFRDPKLNLELIYDTADEPVDFERKWCNAPVALKGIRLQVRSRGGDVVAGELGEKIITALSDKPLPMLIIPPESVGAMISKLRGTSLRSYILNVYFSDGTINEGYKALLGTAAFMGYAELQGHFLMKERLKPEAIII